jgi:hypothetical protein
VRQFDTVPLGANDPEAVELTPTAARWHALYGHGQRLTNAYIQFVADESQAEPTALTFRAQAADNAATFTTASFNVSSRPRTSASVQWSPAASSAGQAGANQRTPNLAAVMQQVVSRPGWASGNAMAFIVNGSGHRTAVAFNGSAPNAPLLHVEYQ